MQNVITFSSCTATSPSTSRLLHNMSAAFRLYRLKKHADQSRRGVAGITGGEGGGWCVWASVFVTKGEEHAWNRGELVSLVKKVTVTFWTNDNKGCRKGGETRHYHKVAPDENTNSPTAGKFRWVNNALQTREVRLLRIKKSVRYKQEVTRKNRCKPMTVENKKTSLHFYWYDKTERFYSECFVFCETKHSE